MTIEELDAKITAVATRLNDITAEISTLKKDNGDKADINALKLQAEALKAEIVSLKEARALPQNVPGFIPSFF